MSNVFGGLRPRSVWRYFDAIRRIPRPSGGEHKICEYLEGWARDRGHVVKRDGKGNMAVLVGGGVSGGGGCLVLQAHLDMVLEKDCDVVFDFYNDPIGCRVEGGYLSSEGTTLGADNGVGVALALASADEARFFFKGELALLFTVEEEVGLAGARELSPDLLVGKYLINLDSEDEAICIGCAGARDVTASLAVRREVVEDSLSAVSVRIRGLQGGHSGVDIHRGRVSAVKLLAEFLLMLRKGGVGAYLVEAGGGSSRNVIAKEAEAVVAFDVDRVEDCVQVARGFAARILERYRSVEPALEIGVEIRGRGRFSVWDREDRNRFVDALLACPHGVMAVACGEVLEIETSNNLARVSGGVDSVVIECLVRSSLAHALDGAEAQVEAVFRSVGAKCRRGNAYPPWQPRYDSRLLEIARSEFFKIYDRPAPVRVVHGGLECSIIGSKIGNPEMISIGPLIRDVHSPRERVDIGSVERTFSLLKGVMSSL